MSRWIAGVCGVLASFLLIQNGFAQEFPSKPVRLISSSGPGTPNDIVLRALANQLHKTLGQPVLVENKLGAGGLIAYEYVAHDVPADGYTYLLGNVLFMTLFPLTVKNLSFDPVKDFTPIIGMGELNLALASSPDAPWTDFKGMQTYIQAHPDKLFYGDTSVFTRFWTEGLLDHFNLRVTRVPYNNAADAARDLLAGTLGVQFVPLSTGLAFGTADRKARILAVTSQRRDPKVPDVPTMTELGAPELAIGSDYTIIARVGIPKTAADAMSNAITQALEDPDFLAFLDKQSLSVQVKNPDQIRDQMGELTETFTRIAKRINYQPE